MAAKAVPVRKRTLQRSNSISKGQERPNETQNEHGCRGNYGSQSRCFPTPTPAIQHRRSSTRLKRKATTPPEPSVTEQIETLRQQLQGQIDALKGQVADKDVQLRQAQQAAADAQAAAAKAQAAADAQKMADSQNAAAVTSLQSTVSDLKNSTALAVGDLSDQTSAIKKAIASPDAIMYKGITLSPAGSFLAAETVWRSAATGGDINTAPTGLPLQNAEGGQLSEFFMSGRQSRVAMRATGKVDKMTLTGYYEADFLSSGTTSNNNQSNSYTRCASASCGAT